MRKKSKKQMPLMPPKIDHPQAQELSTIGLILDSNPLICDLVMQDLSPKRIKSKAKELFPAAVLFFKLTRVEPGGACWRLSTPTEKKYANSIIVICSRLPATLLVMFQLRRYRKRWKIERTFLGLATIGVWLFNMNVELSFIKHFFILPCILIILKQL